MAPLARQFDPTFRLNRTQMTLIDKDGDTDDAVTWKLQYNDLNQLTQRYTGTTFESGASGDERWSYTYDDNGNMTLSKEETHNGSTWSEKTRWHWDWNPRNQMTKARKFLNGSGSHSGKVEYRYCLSCEGAMSERIQYNSSNVVTSWERYEYDGLNLLRADERYNPSGEAIDSNDPWRTIEVNTHRPGQIGALVGKRVYVHTDNDPTADETHDYSYLYDHIGNVFAVVHGNGADDGKEAYYFAQDAFGNEFPLSTLAGDDWSGAENDGIYEHQTGKRLDPFTGLYFFHARWYDSEVGRFVGRDRRFPLDPYSYAMNSPLEIIDPSGNAGLPKDHCQNKVKKLERQLNDLKRRCKDRDRYGWTPNDSDPEIEKHLNDLRDKYCPAIYANMLSLAMNCGEHLS